jgi:hypothetical protein
MTFGLRFWHDLGRIPHEKTSRNAMVDAAAGSGHLVFTDASANTPAAP